MTDSRSHERLIHDLGAGLTPVRRVSTTWFALAWLAVAGVIAAGLSMTYDMHVMIVRLTSAPDMWLAAAGSALTAVLAAKAAFELGIPGRSRAWALLPLPAALLWIGASGMGCLRTWAHVGAGGGDLDCLKFIITFSVPQAVVMVLLLRRAFPLYPALTAAIAGLACAAGSATLLNLCHPLDAVATDLAVHAGAVVVVIGLMTLSGGKLLRR
jgi:hypothetical protein